MTSSPERAVAECVLGLGAEHADVARPATEVPYRRNCFLLVELGWRTEDCRAHLAMHDFAYLPDMAYISCPNRGNAAWSELAVTASQAWHEVVAVDAALRQHPATAAAVGVPPGTTDNLHPARIPLAAADLDAAGDPGSQPCLPPAWRGRTPQPGGRRREWCTVSVPTSLITLTGPRGTARGGGAR